MPDLYRKYYSQAQVDMLVEAAIAATLEKAAKLCEELGVLNSKKPTLSVWQWNECAAAIRSMK